ncbi:MAG: DUF29 domain-containing protein [Acidobacteriota bacterium]|nr:DUF29 domain-containing protein [Acidobacteriota bacterium]
MGVTAAPITSDLHQWAHDTAQAIIERRFDGIDWDKVAKEIISLAGSEERALTSHLAQIIYHLLKSEFQPERHSRSWDLSIKAHRDSIYYLLQEQPSLKSCIVRQDFLDRAYGLGIAKSAKENLPDTVTVLFPATCPYTVETLLPDLSL